MSNDDAKYEVRYWYLGSHYEESKHSTIDDALEAAKALDERLDYGDNGISFLYDTQTGEVADVGNGALRDHNDYDAGPYAKPIKWVKPKRKI